MSEALHENSFSWDRPASPVVGIGLQEAKTTFDRTRYYIPERFGALNNVNNLPVDSATFRQYLYGIRKQQNETGYSQ